MLPLAFDQASLDAGFAIDGSGQITNDGGLDKEVKANHTIFITATEAGLSSTQS